MAILFLVFIASGYNLYKVPDLKLDMAFRQQLFVAGSLFLAATFALIVTISKSSRLRNSTLWRNVRVFLILILTTCGILISFVILALRLCELVMTGK